MHAKKEADAKRTKGHERNSMMHVHRQDVPLDDAPSAQLPVARTRCDALKAVLAETNFSNWRPFFFWIVVSG